MSLMNALDAYLDARDAYKAITTESPGSASEEMHERDLSTARSALEREVAALKLERMDVKGDFNLSM